MNSARCILIFFCIACLWGSLAAQEVDGQKSTGLVADYGPAFELLTSLGIPDAKGSSRVKLVLQNAPQQGGYDRYGGYSMVKTEQDGNAWVFPESKDGAYTLIYEPYQIITVIKKKKRSGLMRALVGKAKTSDAGAVGDWEPVDVTMDTQKIVKSLDAMLDEGRVFEASRWQYDSSYAKFVSRVLVTACHLYRAGHKKEGNQLAHKILSLVPDPTKVIDSIVNDLAHKRYEALVDDFEKTKNWKAYYDGLVVLLEQFPRGWEARLGARILLTKIKQKINGEQPKLATFKGVTIKAEAVEILNDLTKRSAPISMPYLSHWLLLDSTALVEENGLSQDTEKWISELLSMGMDGFLALASAASDESLMNTFILHPDYSYGQYSYRSYSGQSIEEKALNTYASMRRPCSRGEIARKLLISTMPDPDGNLQNLPPEDLQSIAYQWWLTHRSNSKSELAKHFLESGNRESQRIAIEVLIRNGNDEDAELIEEHIISAQSLDDTMELVEPYLKARKGKARKFFQTYSGMLKDFANANSDSLPWSIRDEKKLEEYIKRLSVHVDEISQDKVLADVESGEITLKQALAMLDAVSSDGDDQMQLSIYVSLAAGRNSLLESCQVLEHIVRKNSSALYGRHSEPPSKEVRAKMLNSFVQSKSDWGKLLSRTDSPEGDEEKAILQGSKNLQVYAAWSMEILYFPEHAQRLYTIQQILGREKMERFIVGRAEALLRNPETADFPDPNKLDPARGEKIRGDIAKLNALEIAAYYEGLPLFEKLAWDQIIEAYGESLPKGVVGLSKLIANVGWAYAPGADKELQKEMSDFFQGKELTRELVVGFVDLLSKDPKKYSDYLFAMNISEKPGQRIRVQVMGSEAGSQWKRSLISSDYEKLLNDEISALIGVAGYEDREWVKGVNDLSGGGGGDAEAVNKVIDLIMKNLNSGEGFNASFFTETSENARELANDEGDF